jgi:predicted DNA-binding transcriptional regulator YafY
VTNNPFLDHGKNIDAEVDKFIQSGYGIFLGDKTRTVKIRFTGKAAQIVRTQTWHPSQKRIQNENGEVELSFEAANLTEVLSKVLSFGSSAAPLAPEELVDLWKDEIKKLSSCL